MPKNRSDGYVIKKHDDPFHSIVPYVMPKRTEAEVSMTETFDVTKLNEYLKEKNVKDGTNCKFFHAVCTAAARTIYHRPKLNIFIAGRHFYQRKDITLSFVAKQMFNDQAHEVLMFMKIEPDMTLEDISKKIIGDVTTAREDKGNDLDGTMDFVGKLPRFILEILFKILRFLEYEAIFPKGLMKGDPNYSSLLLSNLGSIGAKSCYHHLSNYGTLSFMMTIGKIREEAYINKETGKVESRNVVDMTFNLDERIADGFYFAKSLRIFKYLFDNPEKLMETIETELPEDLIAKY